MDPVKHLQALINHYCRLGYYQHVVDACAHYRQRHGNDPIFTLWRGFAQAMLGNVGDAIAELKRVKSRREVSCASIQALVIAHSRSSQIDEVEISQLRKELEQSIHNAPDSAKIQLAMLWSHYGDTYEAQKIADNLPLDYRDRYMSRSNVHGWVRLTSRSHAFLLEFEKYFGESETDKPDLETLLGRAKSLELVGKTRDALDVLNRILVNFPDFHTALTEKAKLLVQIGEWEQVEETCLRVLEKHDKKDIGARVYNLLYMMVREYNDDSVAIEFDRLVSIISQRESRNHQLMYKICRTVSRLYGSNNDRMLSNLLKLIVQAQRMNPSLQQLSDYLTEEGHIYLLKNDYTKADIAFGKALEYEESNLSASRGQAKCYLATEDIDAAMATLGFLIDLEDTIEDHTSGGAAELAYLNAQTTIQYDNDMDTAIEHLDNAFKLFCKEYEEKLVSFEFYATFNTHLLLDIANEYLQFCSGDPADGTEPQSPVVEKACKVLDLLVKFVPGSINGQLLLAKAKYLCGDFEAAKTVIHRCLKLNPAFSDAHLLAANILFLQEDYTAASNNLERALSFDFTVKDRFSYRLIRAKVNAATGELGSAIALLQRAMHSINPADPVPLHEQASLYLELTNVHQRMEHQIEAKQTIKEAMHKFKGTPEEGRIIIGKARLLCKRNEVDEAMKELNAVRPGSKYFLKAKSEIAYMHLNLRNDKNAFTKCFEELVDIVPMNTTTYTFLGNAYMNIGQPERAIDAYKCALDIDPENTQLRSKIGTSLISTHNFDEAIRYYEDAVRQNPESIELCHELANICIKLRQYTRAEHILMNTIDALDTKNELVNLTSIVQSLLLLHKVKHAADPHRSDLGEDLLRAKSIQDRVFSKLKGGQQETLLLQRKLAADICFSLGKYNLERRNIGSAITYFDEGVSVDETHEDSMLSLARIYLRRNDPHMCAKHCRNLLRINPSQEEANIMMTDIIFRDDNLEEAIHYFEQHQPDNFHAMKKLIRSLYRAGKLETAEKFITAAERAQSERTKKEPGLLFCRGLFNMFRNNLSEALDDLNQVRLDTEWGGEALYYMIRIYLRPENVRSLSEGSDAPANIDAAEQLLSELKKPVLGNTISEHKKTILEAEIRISKGKKSDAEEAAKLLVKLMQEDRDDVAVIVTLALAFQALKQTPKAKSHLKRVAKMEFDQRYAEDFETGWLVLSEMYVSANKSESAHGLLKLILKHNKSCHRAWELLGLGLEKENASKDASECYANAWKLTNEKDPKIGFKLAFNMMRCKRYVKAIDVCNKVLRQYPDFPKIRKEVLDQCRPFLRA